MIENAEDGQQIAVDSEARKNEYEYEEILNIIGFGKSQWLVLFVGGIFLMAVINETMGMSIIILASHCDFQTSSQERAILSVATFVGILVSSYYWGYLSDTIGRRAVLIKTTLLANAFALISIFVSNFWMFVVLRFLTGIGLSGASSTVYAYLGEFNTLKNRPIVINYASMFVGISTVYTAAIAWLILPEKWGIQIYEGFEIHSWRMLILFYMIPGFLGVLVLSALPESPQFLVSQGRNTEAMNAIQWICNKNHGKNSKHLQGIVLKSEVNCGGDTVLPKTIGLDFLKMMWTQTRPLFRQPHAINFLICCVIMFGLFLCSGGLGLWYPEIQNVLGNSVTNAEGNTGQAICQVIDSFLEKKIDENTTIEVDADLQECKENINTKTFMDAIILGLSFIVGYIILGMVLNSLGRKRVLIIALTIAGVSGISLQWVQQQEIVVVLFCFIIMLPGLSISILSGAIVDLIPTKLRGKAVCICLMLGRSGSVIGSNFIGSILESYCCIVFNTFAGFILRAFSILVKVYFIVIPFFLIFHISVCVVLTSFLPI